MNITYRTPTLEEMGEFKYEYESPIEAIFDHFEESFEENVYKAVQSYGINVDKEELEQALIYDRHQYEKGYADGKRAGLERMAGKWNLIGRVHDIYDFGGYESWGMEYRCSKCGFIHMAVENHGVYQYCPHCGAHMEMEGELDKEELRKFWEESEEWEHGQV